jgi:transcriptional regulator with XRE-family HTH domain
MTSLCEYLREENLTAVAFAKRMGVAPYTVRRWLAGQRRPSWHLLPKIGEVTHGRVDANSFVCRKAA